MTMPTIPKRTREEAITDVIESIALEETALAHLINAEADKIEHYLKSKTICPDKLIALNKTVEQVLKTIIKKEMLLQFKLETAMDTKPPCPPPPCPPKPLLCPPIIYPQPVVCKAVAKVQIIGKPVKRKKKKRKIKKCFIK
ncbi:hypothetical protein [Heliorestis convoluta]|uniref:Uncharacterized protein n=1 Tax=Heliorestis convoluta TaxID=356322 RepID=A0A5Q2N7W1_9FIRM|nr:hypothetical protein [Heliorestis convoluta]QGG48575.1 hypothetical protein FTV88_2482 [Heliorestis convoluta]